MTWDVDFLPEADRDLDELAHSQQVIVKKAIKKVKQNPLPTNEGGYGKPLGHRRDLNLTNLLKIKLLKEGIRVVYKLIRTETKMLIIVVGIREDKEVYKIASERRIKHNI
jgi:mRNA interferase RelE/StbE